MRGEISGDALEIPPCRNGFGSNGLFGGMSPVTYSAILSPVGAAKRSEADEPVNIQGPIFGWLEV